MERRWKFMNVTVPAASLRRKRAAERHRRNDTEHQSSQKRQALTLSRVSADRPAAAARNQPFHHHLAEDDPEASCALLTSLSHMALTERGEMYERKRTKKRGRAEFTASHDLMLTVLFYSLLIPCFLLSAASANDFVSVTCSCRRSSDASLLACHP